MNLSDFLKLPDTIIWEKTTCFKGDCSERRSESLLTKLTSHSTPKFRDHRVWLKESAETVGRQDSEAPVRVQWCRWGQGSCPANGLLVGFLTVVQGTHP